MGIDAAAARPRIGHQVTATRDGAVGPRLNQLCVPETAEIVFESIRFRQTRGDWFVRLALLMPDHLHALMAFPADRQMKDVICTWKEMIAKTAGIRWQRDFFDHRLRAADSYDEKANYIRMNPVRKNIVPRPQDWAYVWEPD